MCSSFFVSQKKDDTENSMNVSLKDGLNEIQKIVSPEWFNDDKTTPIYQKGRMANPKAIEPLAYVYPKDREEIQAILKTANEYGIAIWPTSKGKNSGFGSATSKQEDNVVMVLERLNRIIEVDETLGYAVLEPGVTFQDLHDYLNENNINLCIDAIDGPADGSVLGNALERGRGGTNYGDHFSNLCGVEFILPNGEVMKTGGGPQNSQSWNVYKYGVGPSVDGLFTQGNFGVAVQGGIWLMPKHECCTSIFFELHSSEQLKKAIGIFQQLQLNGVIESTVRLGTEYALMSGVLAYPKHLAKEGFLGQSALDQLRSEHNVGLWGAAASIYGSKEVVKVKQKIIKKAFKGFGPIAFIGDKQADFLAKVVNSGDGSGEYNPLHWLVGKLLKAVTKKELKFLRPTINIHNFYHRGVPTDHAVERGAFGKPACPGCEQPKEGVENTEGIIWFAPVVPNRGEVIDHVNTSCKRIFHEYKFDYAAGIFLYGPRSGMVISKIIYDKSIEGEAERALQALKALHDWATEEGFQVYRSSISMMDYVLDCNPEYKDFIGKIKRAVDPNNIIAPGKYGIGSMESPDKVLLGNDKTETEIA